MIKTKAIEVPFDLLLLDPANPRFGDAKLSSDAVRISNPTLQDRIRNQIESPSSGYRIDELRKQILANGWQSGDPIFVQKDGTNYLVLEGNRRVTALRGIREENNSDEAEAIRAATDILPVIEVPKSADAAETQKQIAKLLGMRHHGSLKQWTPFAQARNIYDRYLQKLDGDGTDIQFHWDEATAGIVASELGINIKKIDERLRTFRVMNQLNRALASEGNPEPIKHSSYSVVWGCLERAKKTEGSFQKRKYIRQDPDTFELDPPSAQKLILLCKFEEPGRKGSPIPNPTQWIWLERILSEEDGEIRAASLHAVEAEQRTPREVYSERWAERLKPNWESWMDDILQVFATLSLSDLTEDADSESTAEVIQRLTDRLKGLQQEIHGGF